MSAELEDPFILLHDKTTNNNCLSRKPWMFQPKLSAFATMRLELSSNATKIPGSSNPDAPCTRNWSAKMVLPEPDRRPAGSCAHAAVRRR